MIVWYISQPLFSTLRWTGKGDMQWRLPHLRWGFMRHPSISSISSHAILKLPFLLFLQFTLYLKSINMRNQKPINEIEYFPTSLPRILSSLYVVNKIESDSNVQTDIYWCLSYLRVCVGRCLAWLLCTQWKSFRVAMTHLHCRRN